MNSVDERIARLEEKIQQQEAVLKQQLLARKRAQDIREERARDTRREVLVGAAVLAAVKLGEWPRDQLLALLDLKLLQSADRALFRLPPLELPPESEFEEMKEPGNF